MRASPRLGVLTLITFGLPCEAIDLSTASVTVQAALGPSGDNAATVLIEEVEKRTGVRMMRSAGPRRAGPSISLGVQSAGPPEGYSITVAPESGVSIQGTDARGLLFGVGRLLRALNMSQGALQLSDEFAITTAPRYPLRGHQIGYRPKTNSYDGWDVAQMDQYVRDLAVFGTNAIELIPPRSDDDADSPHFRLPPMQMMIAMSRIIAGYGLQVWVWYPALDKDYSDRKTVEFALKEWGEIFRQLPKIDAVFVPGGDPGHTEPKHLMALLAKQMQNLRRYHPNAQMWMSPQGFSQEWFSEFNELLRKEPAWLTGLVYGPQVRGSIEELRRSTPQRYLIRNYPDITHSLRAQHVVPDWDVAHAMTQHREPINPRPLDMASIFRYEQPHTAGFITYSEGCNDDVNKIVWSALGWDPDQDIPGILEEYGRYFIGSSYGGSFAQTLLALERNWRGPLATNEGVVTTLEQLQALERQASPGLRLNWRFQQALYRAYYDAYTRQRLRYESALEEDAVARLREAPRTGSLAAVAAASQILNRALTEPVAAELRKRVFELADALYQSIRMQLSVPR
jgi:hypothetical protein